jgi:hypothetical protein
MLYPELEAGTIIQNIEVLFKDCQSQTHIRILIQILHNLFF